MTRELWVLEGKGTLDTPLMAFERRQRAVEARADPLEPIVRYTPAASQRAGRVVHVAGEPIRIGFQGVQRCSFCGEAIYNEDLRNLYSSSPCNNPLGFYPFPTGAFVAVDGPSTMVIAGEASATVTTIPAGFCGDDAPALRVVR